MTPATNLLNLSFICEERCALLLQNFLEYACLCLFVMLSCPVNKNCYLSCHEFSQGWNCWLYEEIFFCSRVTEKGCHFNRAKPQLTTVASLSFLELRSSSWKLQGSYIISFLLINNSNLSLSAWLANSWNSQLSQYFLERKVESIDIKHSWNDKREINSKLLTLRKK